MNKQFKIEQLKRNMILLAEKEGKLKIEEDNDEVRFKGTFTIKGGRPIIIK